MPYLTFMLASIGFVLFANFLIKLKISIISSSSLDAFNFSYYFLTFSPYFLIYQVMIEFPSKSKIHMFRGIAIISFC